MVGGTQVDLDHGVMIVIHQVTGSHPTDQLFHFPLGPDFGLLIRLASLWLVKPQRIDQPSAQQPGCGHKSVGGSRRPRHDRFLLQSRVLGKAGALLDLPNGEAVTSGDHGMLQGQRRLAFYRSLIAKLAIISIHTVAWVKARKIKLPRTQPVVGFQVRCRHPDVAALRSCFTEVVLYFSQAGTHACWVAQHRPPVYILDGFIKMPILRGILSVFITKSIKRELLRQGMLFSAASGRSELLGLQIRHVDNRCDTLFQLS